VQKHYLGRDGVELSTVNCV